jgi:broad-specificity NMP kinase
MKTTSSQRIKDLKANMRSINELLNNYQAMEEAQQIEDAKAVLAAANVSAE